MADGKNKSFMKNLMKLIREHVIIAVDAHSIKYNPGDESMEIDLDGEGGLIILENYKHREHHFGSSSVKAWIFQTTQNTSTPPGIDSPCKSALSTEKTVTR